MPDEVQHVRISELRVLRGSGSLVILGLGSCVGVFMRDLEAKVGGGVHVMLPDSRTFSQKHIPAKYADTAIPALVEAMVREGADVRRLEAKMAGGANMFASTSNPDLLPLGLRNVMAAREALKSAGVPLKVEEVGGIQGRSVYFQVPEGRLLVKRVQQPDAWF